MNGNNLLLDTNIILYLLNGDVTLVQLLEDKQLYLSFITQLELLSYHSLENNELKIIESFIDDCTVIDISSKLKEYVIELRKKYKMKLPDAIIAASSLYMNVPLVTADSGFKKLTDDIDLVYYEK